MGKEIRLEPAAAAMLWGLVAAEEARDPTRKGGLDAALHRAVVRVIDMVEALDRGISDDRGAWRCQRFADGTIVIVTTPRG